MAVIVLTQYPNTLLKSIKESIGSKKVTTWNVDSDGDFTHNPSQWLNEAWFRPSIETDRIVFKILKQREKNITTSIYGVYHGRFIEMLLNHFDEEFTEVRATALPSAGDIVSD
jgi:hypothetical protein